MTGPDRSGDRVMRTATPGTPAPLGPGLLCYTLEISEYFSTLTLFDLICLDLAPFRPSFLIALPRFPKFLPFSSKFSNRRDNFLRFRSR
jgi:hypothetical protein